MELQQHINNIIDELENSSINKQRKRYLESHLNDLQEYQKNNPLEKNIPGPLELYCDLNPEAPECRIYDD